MQDLEKNIGLLMRVSVITAVVIMLIGTILLIIQGNIGIDFLSGSMNLSEILSGLLTLKPGSYLALGLFCLILTPIVRVIGSIYSFARIHDKLYVVITSLVLCILIVCFLLGISL